MNHSLLTNAADLTTLKQNSDLLIVDLGSHDQYLSGHIPDAIHVSYADITSELPTSAGALPTHFTFTQALQKLGIQEHQHILAYDHSDNAQACRFLWSLDLINHSRYSLLDGGMQAYLRSGQATEQSENNVKPHTQPLHYNPSNSSTDINYILKHYQDPNVSIIDARSEAEYRGTDIRSQRGGHIPGAINLDYRHVFEDNHPGKFRPLSELTALIEQGGINLENELICHCQSHRRSAVIYFVFKLLGAKHIKGYPGSWAEWGNKLDTPIT